MFEGFSAIFLSIFLEAVPFIILGALVSSLIEIFIRPEDLAKVIPKNKFVGYTLIALLGIVFPVCECAIVPIMRRLMKKGMPTGLAITFMLAVPIVNPVVLMSTGFAFSSWYVPALRAAMGFFGAVLIGVIFDKVPPGQVLIQHTPKLSVAKFSPTLAAAANVPSQDSSISSSSTTVTIHQNEKKKTPKKTTNRWIALLRHANSELYDVGRFLIVGALLSALLQTVVPRKSLLLFGSNPFLSIAFMMLLAFVLSLCSEADAFIASTFRTNFTAGSLMGFMVFGPMIDIKNTLMLLGAFKRKFVLKLIGVITLVNFATALAYNLLIGGQL